MTRYLVEDNYDDYVIYDEDRYNELHIVKCIFKKLIGKYELFTEEESYRTLEELSKVFMF